MEGGVKRWEGKEEKGCGGKGGGDGEVLEESGRGVEGVSGGKGVSSDMGMGTWAL